MHNKLYASYIYKYKYNSTILNVDSVFKSLGILFQYFEARTLRQLYEQGTATTLL